VAHTDQLRARLATGLPAGFPARPGLRCLHRPEPVKLRPSVTQAGRMRCPGQAGEETRKAEIPGVSKNPPV
jgi:hypothetical protein